MAEIQFSQGIKEDVIPDVRLTRSKDGKSGTASFYFEQPKALSNDSNEEITGMYLVDDEGEIVIKDVKAKFINGRPVALDVFYPIRTLEEWDRFIRFMNKYAQENELGFTKSE